MSTKKKFIIALCAVSVVAVTLLASLIAVVASFNAKTTAGGFKVSYTAKNVNATIAAEYTKNDEAATAIKTTEGENLITFSNEDIDEEVTKSFAETDLTIGKDDVIVLHYTITNTATDGSTFRVVSHSSITTETNVNVKYSSNGSTWVDAITGLDEADSVAVGTPLNLYIQISVATKTQPATFNGQFNFELIVNG